MRIHLHNRCYEKAGCIGRIHDPIPSFLPPGSPHGSERVGETQSSQKAASRCLQQLTVCASAPGDRSESVPRLCKLFILPLEIPQHREGTLPWQVLSPAQVGGQKECGENRLNPIDTLITPLISLEWLLMHPSLRQKRVLNSNKLTISFVACKTSPPGHFAEDMSYYSLPVGVSSLFHSFSCLL